MVIFFPHSMQMMCEAKTDLAAGTAGFAVSATGAGAVAQSGQSAEDVTNERGEFPDLNRVLRHMGADDLRREGQYIL